MVIVADKVILVINLNMATVVNIVVYEYYGFYSHYCYLDFYGHYGCFFIMGCIVIAL
jgi:hypothetical protein